MLHDSRKKIDPNKKGVSLNLLYYKYKNVIKNIIILITLFMILFYPDWCGNLIGNWVKDFFGTIINIIKTI